jgi:hypothetical protein
MRDKKFKKRKKREKLAKAKIAHIREKTRAKARKERLEQAAMDAEFADLNKIEPYVKESTKRERNEKIKEQIRHNIKILEALKEEYEQAEAEKNRLNQELEDKGLTTLKDKMAYLDAEARKETGEETEEEV